MMKATYYSGNDSIILRLNDGEYVKTQLRVTVWADSHFAAAKKLQEADEQVWCCWALRSNGTWVEQYYNPNRELGLSSYDNAKSNMDIFVKIRMWRQERWHAAANAPPDIVLDRVG